MLTSNIIYIVNHFIPVVIRKESPEEVKKDTPETQQMGGGRAGPASRPV